MYIYELLFSLFIFFQDENLARFVVGSHIRHHPSATPTPGNGAGESPGHANLMRKAGAEPIEQDLLRKYIVYSKEKVHVYLLHRTLLPELLLLHCAHHLQLQVQVETFIYAVASSVCFAPQVIFQKCGARPSPTRKEIKYVTV